MIYFISGHRDLTPTEFELYYAPVIRKAINSDNHTRFVLGLYEGADQMALQFLEELNFDPYKITIYESENSMYLCLNTEFKKKLRFECYIDPNEADSIMTLASDIDIAFIRPGKEDSHTAKNILRRCLMNNQ